MPAVPIPYTAAQTAQIAPLARAVHGPLRIPSLQPAEFTGPISVRVPGRGTALYEITLGPPCSTDACYVVRVQAFATAPVTTPDMLNEDLPDGGIGYYHLREHTASMLATYPGQGYRSYLIDCTCDFDQLNTIARSLTPLPVY